MEFRITSEQSEVHADFITLFRLHDERRGERGGSSLTQRSRMFHRDFASAALAAGWLRLWFLEIDGEPVAAWYGWRLGDCYSYYQTGFSPAWADRSVGFVLMSHTIRAAIEEGASEYDLLLGEDDYKSRFVTGQRYVETVVASRSHSPMASLAKLEGMMWGARERLPPAIREHGTSAYRLVARLAPAMNRR